MPSCPPPPPPPLPPSPLPLYLLFLLLHLLFPSFFATSSSTSTRLEIQPYGGGRFVQEFVTKPFLIDGRWNTVHYNTSHQAFLFHQLSGSLTLVSMSPSHPFSP